MTAITEPARDIPVRSDTQVLVAGGGLSGVCAAVAAARAGADVLLVEPSQTLGGVATAGLMASCTNRFIAADGTQVIRGLAGEIMDRLVELGGARPNWQRPEVPQLPYDPERLQVVLVRMLRDARVRVLLGAMVTAAWPESNRLAVIIEHRAGREAALADVAVDATGDAVLAAALGAEFADISPASASLEFRMAGVDLAALFEHFRRHPEDFACDYDQVTTLAEFERNWTELGILHLPHGGGERISPIQESIRRGAYAKRRGLAHGLDALGLYGTADTDTVIVNSNFYSVDSLDPGSISAAAMDARERCLETAQLLKEVMPGFERAYLIATAAQLGVRISRRILGQATLTRAALTAGQRFPDVIAVQRRVEPLPRADRLAPGVSEIPYGMLVPREVELLVVASGKTASTDPRGLLRAQASCMALGHAAGVAAGLAANARVPPRELPVREIQRLLLEQGAYLGSPERLAELGLA